MANVVDVECFGLDLAVDLLDDVMKIGKTLFVVPGSVSEPSAHAVDAEH